jgi:hypothetical protein
VIQNIKAAFLEIPSNIGKGTWDGIFFFSKNRNSLCGILAVFIALFYELPMTKKPSDASTYDTVW